MKKIISIVSVILICATQGVLGQTISLTSAPSPVKGTICPQIPTTFSINAPAGCTPTWSATNGQLNTANGQRTMSVTWDDTPGATATLSVTFSGCTKSGDNSKSASWSSLILSVKDQTWDAYGNVVNVDFCTRRDVTITMPRMFVQGTGGIAQPPLQEVQYAWTLPPGWATRGSLITDANFITIYPIQCSLPGQVQVNGSVKNRCGSAGLSAPAIINLNGVTPAVTMAPQLGYTGVSTACNTTPVTFTAATNLPFSCLTGYTWTMPAGWKINSQSGNTVVLQPSGSEADRGDIYATANFSCGSKYNSGSYPIRYVDPTITSSANAICTTSQFSINNATGVSATWSSSSPAGLSFNSTGLATRINNYSGRVTVSATLSCGTTVSPTSMFVGNPAASNNTLIWLRTRGESSVQTLPGTTYEFRVDNVDGANAYTWVIPRGFAPLWGSKTVQTTSIYITTSPVAGTYSFFCRAENACGSSPTRSLVINNRIGGGGGAPLRTTASLPYQEATVYPNPANKVLNVQLAIPEAGVSQMMDSPIELMLYNSNKKLVYQTVTTDVLVSISLDDIPKGDYFLIISSKQKVDQKRIRVTN